MKTGLRIWTSAMMRLPKASVPTCQKVLKKAENRGNAGTSSGFLKAKYHEAKAPANVH